ncbi:glycosyltransferase [Microbacterium invictum]|uniref:Glycosyltransferase n=1 Tax=Microbacterium invictum TaxID=515415 RepID=A0ABZ0VC32_9MICO|nr:glycosyltransferase [Microbacterium invictum]WQB69690.1 glycosyltransferase [Microbacterium invictum]
MTAPLRVLSLYEGFFAGGARVLHTDVVAGLHAGGQSHRVLSIASRARREATVQRMGDDPRCRRLVDAGVEVRSLGRTAGDQPLAPETFGPRHLRRAATMIAQADVVVSLKEQPLGLLLALRDRGMMPDVPVAVCLHRSDPAHAGAAREWLAEAAWSGLVSTAISCADSTRDAYRDVVGEGIDARVVPNGIDTERFRPGTARERAAIRRSLGIPADAPVVLFAARFDAMKNPGLFLRAVAAHARHRHHTRYLLCGAGMSADNPALRAAIAEAGVPASARIHLLGIRDDMPALHRIADIVALTSAFGEASPLCLIEGAASGATPVTTAVGDAARVVEGFGIVTAHDSVSIAGAWDAVLAERPAFRRLALAARPRLSRERMVQEYRLAIESLAVRVPLAA